MPPFFEILLNQPHKTLNLQATQYNLSILKPPKNAKYERERKRGEGRFTPGR